MRLVFFGSGLFGLPTLQRLVREHEIALVVTQPDRPAGRHRALTPTPIAEFAQQAQLHVIKPGSPNDPATIAQIHGMHADAFVVIAYGQKLGGELLGETFAINLHGSLLPKYRGAAPINWAIINIETETGVSVITLAQRMDAGAILAQRATPIGPMDTAGEVHDRLAEFGPEVICDVLAAHQAGTLQPMPQDDSQATAAPKLSKKDGTVSFDQPAERVRARVHGVTPSPGCTVRLAGQTVKLIRVQAVDLIIEDASPGQLLEGGLIACQPGAVRIIEIQPPGKRMMTFEEYSHGHAIAAGARCENV